MLKGLKESFNKYIKQKLDCITVINVKRDNPDESKKIEHRTLNIEKDCHKHFRSTL